MERIHVGICDDMPEAIEQIYKIITPYLENSKWDIEVCTFENGEEVLKEIEKLHILFLDIEMPGIDGIEVGGMFQRKNPACRIIMATGMEYRFKEAFKIAAFRFVTKPFEEKEVIEAFTEALDTMRGLETIELYERRNLYSIPQRKICVVKAYDSFVEAYVEGKWMRRRDTIAGMCEELDETLFYQIDRRFLVNMMHIDKYKNGVVEVAGERFKVSRRRRKDFEQAYREFDLKYGRVSL
ncbi:MAG: response regulator transcription factor [Lachnospiraceae bacterium]|nr:response regulator transcription factor [Lachnospiraceae bacterium]